MLDGVARKVAVPFTLLSLAGWVTFGVGFGIRNFEYQDRADRLEDASASINLTRFVNLGYDSAARPEFFFQWLFGVSTPFLLFFTLFHLFCGVRATSFTIQLLLPFFLIGAGGVLLFSGLQIYQYYREKDDPYFRLNVEIHDRQVYFNQLLNLETGAAGLQVPEIHGDDRYIVVEFAGAISSVVFYWVCLLLTPFFALKHE